MKKITLSALVPLLVIFLFPFAAFSQSESVFANPDGSGVGELFLIISLVAVTFIAAIFLEVVRSSFRAFAVVWRIYYNFFNDSVCLHPYP